MKPIIAILSAFCILPSAIAQEWNFNSPTDTNNVVVSPGPYSVGWQSTLSGIGTNQGWWDLGQQGFIVATTDVPAINAAVFVEVTTWIDGGIFPAPQITVAGTLLSLTIVTNSTGNLGSWQTISTVWQVNNAQTVVAVSQPDPSKGCLVDRIAVSYAVPRQPPQPRAIALPKANEDFEAQE
jgi:hypothetical protein